MVKEKALVFPGKNEVVLYSILEKKFGLTKKKGNFFSFYKEKVLILKPNKQIGLLVYWKNLVIKYKVNV